MANCHFDPSRSCECMIFWKPGQYPFLARFFHLYVKNVYNLLHGHSRLVCWTLEQLSWVFGRIWSLLQATRQLCSPKCWFVFLVVVLFFFFNELMQLVPELISCNCYSRDTADCSRSCFRDMLFLRVSVCALFQKRTILKPMMHLAQVVHFHPPPPWS